MALRRSLQSPGRGARQRTHDASDALRPGPACRGARVPPGVHPEVPTPGGPEPSVRDAMPGEALPGLTVVATPRSLASSTLCSPTQDGHTVGVDISNSRPSWSSVAPRPYPVCGYWSLVRETAIWGVPVRSRPGRSDDNRDVVPRWSLTQCATLVESPGRGNTVTCGRARLTAAAHAMDKRVIQPSSGHPERVAPGAAVRARGGSLLWPAATADGAGRPRAGGGGGRRPPAPRRGAAC